MSDVQRCIRKSTKDTVVKALTLGIDTIETSNAASKDAIKRYPPDDELAIETAQLIKYLEDYVIPTYRDALADVRSMDEC